MTAPEYTQALPKELATPRKQLKENLRPAAYNVEAQSLHFTKTNKVLQRFTCHESCYLPLRAIRGAWNHRAPVPVACRTVAKPEA